MTTTPTTEPSEAEVEAAAQEMFVITYDLSEWHTGDEYIRFIYRRDARAALRAAAKVREQGNG